MEKKTWTPPDFLGRDTSNVKLRDIPPLSLGLPKLYQANPASKIFVSVIRVRDVSGTQFISRR
jgi:hypothetical protein